MGPLFSHAKWTCELAIKWTQRQKSTGKSPHFSGSTVHGPRPHFIDTRVRAKKKNFSPHPTLNCLRIKAVSTFLRHSKRENKNDA